MSLTSPQSVASDAPLLAAALAFHVSQGEEKYFKGELHSENLPGLGHFMHLEDPQRIAAAVLDFVGPARRA